MSKLIRELIGQLSPERRESIEARAQVILSSMTFKHCSERDNPAGLSEQETDQITVAQTKDDMAGDAESLE